MHLLDTERLVGIPESHRRKHEFCFFVHDQILEMLKQYEASGIHNAVANGFAQAMAKHRESDSSVDMLSFLKEHGLVQHYKHHIVSHLVMGLTADMLHFIYESLRCFEKRKFAVGFALLRKPLKENLVFLCWLLADQDDFITRFEANNYETLNGLKADRRKELLQKAIEKLPISEMFDADTLCEMIFSKKSENGLEPLWQRATHLITSQGDLLKTEDLSINFIFHDASSDHLYDDLYRCLPYSIVFAMNVALECFARILEYNEKTVSHLLLTTMGCYESLFRIRPRSITKMLSRSLAPFLKCVHCSTRFRMTRENSISMYWREHIYCFKCEMESPFPLYWLLSTAKIAITRDPKSRSILNEESL